MKRHLIGIGGVGMSALAVALANLGDEVTGADRTLGTRNIEFLESLGIHCHPDDGSGVDGTVDYANQLIDAIFSHTPDVTIYLQSVTPILYGHEIGDLNNETIRNFDEALQSYCKDNGYKYLDIYHVVCDDDGYLAEENCGDPGAQGIHFTDAGCQKWIDYLKENVNA